MRRSSASKKWASRRLVKGSIFAGLLVAASCSQEAQQSPQDQGTECVAPLQACNGSCVDLGINPENCGSCGVTCLSGRTCQAGQCVLNCVAPQIDCGGLCADPASNSLHCGGCNRPCAGGQICQSGTCVTGSCPAGQVQCNGACVDTASDPLNCGNCAATCTAVQTCQSGACVGGGAGSGTGGSAGVGTGGAAGIGTGGTAGGGMGGSAGTSTGGTAGTPSTGGAGQGGSMTGGTAGNAGKGTSVPQSASCPNITWPASNGSRNLGSGITVTGVHDGGMQIHNGSLENCANGDQDSTDPLIEVANGGTVRNVIMGNNVGDGIHCLGSCTIENVWFPYVCDDAITILGSGTVNIRNSGFKNARDKTIQHNGTATVNIQDVYVETAGKLYRSCGEGCSASSRRTANLTNIVAIGVDQVAGVSTNDTVTLRNICVHRTFSICSMYDPGTSDPTESGVNSSNEGPSANCVFGPGDTHALLSRVGGIPFTTESVCGGPNGYKSGNTATSCVSGFNSCLKACMPGGYGFKQITCTNGRYAEGTGVICAMPTDTTAAQNLAPSRVMGATAMVEGNGTCSTQWATGREATNNNNYCLCVHKPGYYSNSNWLAWDCQPRWW